MEPTLRAWWERRAMGSGAGGPWLRLLPMLREQGVDAPVCLTDHDPNIEALEWARKRSGGVR